MVSSNSAKTEYIISSKDWDAEIASGECMKIDFTANVAAGGSAPKGTVFLEGSSGSTGTVTSSQGSHGGHVTPTNPVAHGHGS